MRAAAYLKKFRDFTATAYAEISRLARKSPEGTGAVAGLFTVPVVALLFGAVGGYLKPAPAPPIVEPVPAETIAPAETPAPTATLPSAPAPAPSSRPPPDQPGAPFVDRFADQSLNEGRWFVSDGWSNGDWMENDWQRSQISVTPEGLRMTLGPSPGQSDKPFASGEIRTYATFKYGYFEVRMRVPRDPGLVIGAFTYASANGRTRPNEIDIEILGRATRKVELTIHENGRATSKIVDLPFDAAGGFHTYGIEWLRDRVRWYADGELIHEEAGPRAANLTRPQQFLVSLWASRKLNQWVGEFDPSSGPWTLDIACVAYSQSYAGEQLC
jgi:endo-1,3-1,4-beta-glycanase ExoK